MKEVGFICCVAVLALIGCIESEKTASENDQVLLRIDNLETAFFNGETTKSNPKTGMALVRAYAHFYNENQKDSLAADMLFKAGEVSMGIRQGNLAVKYFRIISDDHQNFKKAPEALFLCGFCSENLNTDTADARFYYEAFISKYPEHHLAEDVRFSILNLGKSDEELIEMFEQNQSKQVDQ
jgi:outer membrane protein assembly factor BamD (BamD/ComL family)